MESVDFGLETLFFVWMMSEGEGEERDGKSFSEGAGWLSKTIPEKGFFRDELLF